jgi:ABC-type multidrug transport system, ATPase and permease components
VDIKEYRLESLRRNFSVYFQEMGNYCMSLYENVIIGDAEREDEQAVYKALEQSCCGDILDKAIYGLNTNLMRMFDKDGLELSGGQYQKIALARCLYRRSTVLVLDEPSSNLDPKAEHDIFEQIRQLSDNKLTIFTSHRLSNVSLADRIIVLEHGRVVEEGTQKELLEKNQRYAELYRYQSEKFNISESKKGSENDTDSID